jgi:hypothetical protein
MFLKMALTFASCTMVTACFASNLQGQTQKYPDTRSSSNQLTLKQQSNDLNIKNNQPIPTETIAAKKLKEAKNYLTLTPTETKNRLGNPLYQLSLYVDGQPTKTYYAVTGRRHTQGRDRHVAGTEAPLPDGLYQVANSTTPGTLPEVGGRFLPIQPLFKTGRSALGIHYDPSYEKDNGEDGSSGCIALTSKSDFDQVLNYIRVYHPQRLQVSIQPQPQYSYKGQ